MATTRPPIMLTKQAADAAAPPPPAPQARVRWLLAAPHRLSFFLAMLMLMASALWWAWTLVVRTGAVASVPAAMSPMMVHAVVMCFGFLPLYFAGFLFTAGPKWLNVPPWPVRTVAPSLVLQAAGWMLWLAGGMFSEKVALAGGALALFGLVWVTVLFLRLVARSTLEDQVHARCVAVACVLGCASLAGVWVALVAGRFDIARACVHTGLWGFVSVVYVVVAHRMIPFFTSSALPMIDAWRPFWVLWLLLAAMLLRVVDVWMATLGSLAAMPLLAQQVWAVVCGGLEILAGVALLWLAYRWGLVQSLKNRLLAMLHIGFSWMSVAFVLSGGARIAGLWMEGAAGWSLAALHAFTMGALGSLLLAMVTRVSCGHSGRALHADGMVWTLFCLLQVTVVVRIAGAADWSWSAWLLAVAALLWAVVMCLWGTRLCTWYLKPRADGRPG